MDRVTPAEAAARLAEERIQGVGRVRLLWVPGQDRNI
jgi:hypothetical protein